MNGIMEGKMKRKSIATVGTTKMTIDVYVCESWDLEQLAHYCHFHAGWKMRLVQMVCQT